MVIMQVDSTVTVSDRGFSLSRHQNAGTAPGVVHQKPHSKGIDGLLPPGVFQIHTMPSFVIINIIVSNRRIGGGIIRNTGICRSAMTEYGNRLSLQGILRLRFFRVDMDFPPGNHAQKHDHCQNKGHHPFESIHRITPNNTSFTMIVHHIGKNCNLVSFPAAQKGRQITGVLLPRKNPGVIDLVRFP